MAKRKRPIHQSKPNSNAKPALQDDRYWLYGRHAVLAALANPARQCGRLLASENAAQQHLAAIARDRYEILPRGEIEKYLKPDAVHQGLALQVSPLAPAELATCCQRAADNGQTLVLLDSITDPQNVGAVLRHAAAFDVAAVILPQRHSPPETAALAKAASGALDMVDIVRCSNLANAIRCAKEYGFWCLALDANDGAPLDEFLEHRPIAVIAGAEGRGLRPLTRKLCDGAIRLEISRQMASLNVSASLAITLHAFYRQQTCSKRS